MRKLLYLSLAMLLLSGCPHTPQQGASREPALAQHLPRSDSGYVYRGYQVYPTRELGFSLRYVKQDEPYHHADIYIYPDPANSHGMTQQQIVQAATRASAQEIFEAGRLGYYYNVQQLHGEMRQHRGDAMSCDEFVFLHKNLKTFSLLYVTESKGSLIKARVSMPYDRNHLDHKNVDQFVNHMFGAIKQNL